MSYVDSQKKCQNVYNVRFINFIMCRIVGAKYVYPLITICFISSSVLSDYSCATYPYNLARFFVVVVGKLRSVMMSQHSVSTVNVDGNFLIGRISLFLIFLGIYMFDTAFTSTLNKPFIDKSDLSTFLQVLCN